MQHENLNLKKRLTIEVEEAKRCLADLEDARNRCEVYAEVLDEMPIPPGVEITSCRHFIWNQEYNPRIYATTESFALVLPMLEWLEGIFGAECTSTDTSDGTREFRFISSELLVDFTFIVTPVENSADATCRKVLIGEDTETRTFTTPRYAIHCN